MNPYAEWLTEIEYGTRECSINPPRHCGRNAAISTMTSLEVSTGLDNLAKRIVNSNFAIENVIFNNPATIVFWLDGTKTVVKAENEPFDPEKGLAMAIVKKTLGNKGSYYNEFKKWLKNDG